MMNIFINSDRIEFDWMWYVQSQGFFARQALPIIAESGVEDATDIDVWGIRFLPPMVPSVAVVDCKNKQRPKTYERILWTKGMAMHVGADLAFVGAPSPTWRSIDFGRSCGIHVSPHSLIEAHLRELPWGQRAYGQARHDVYGNLFGGKKSLLKSCTGLTEALFRARNLYRLGSPLTNLNRAITGLAESFDAWMHSDGNADRQQLWMLVCCEYITCFSINILRAVSESFTLSPPDRQGFVQKGIKYGDMPARKAESIFEDVRRLAIMYASSIVPDEHRIKLASLPLDELRVDAPAYVDRVAGLIDRIARNPMRSWDSVRLLDAVLFDHVVPGQAVGPLSWPSIGEAEDRPHLLKMAKNIIAVLCDSASVPREPFWRMLPNDAPEQEPTPSEAQGSSS